MQFTTDDIKQLVILAAIIAAGAFAGYQGKWDIVSTIVTGSFALLHIGKKDQG